MPITARWFGVVEGERSVPDDLAHHLEAIGQLDPDEQQAIRALIEGALLRHQARRLAASLASGQSGARSKANASLISSSIVR